MTTEVHANDRVKRLRLDVYEVSAVEPDAENPAAKGYPSYRRRQVAATGQCENGSYFGYTIFCEDSANLFDAAEAERVRAASIYGLKEADIEVEYHDMDIPLSRNVRVASHIAKSIREKYLDMRKKLKL